MAVAKIKADRKVIQSILDERDWDNNLLAEKMRIDPSTLSGYWGTGFPPMAFTMMCMILGMPEEALKYTEPTERPVTEVGEILSNNQVLTELDNMKKTIMVIMEDMKTMAESMSRMERAVFETKAQVDLNAEDIQAINSRTNNLSGTCNRILGSMNAKLKATKGA